jgi:hypothetical protein
MVEEEDFFCYWRLDADTDLTCTNLPSGDPINEQGDILEIELEKPIFQLT